MISRYPKLKFYHNSSSDNSYQKANLFLNAKKVANNTEQQNTTCSNSVKINLPNIRCGYRALTVKSKCSLLFCTTREEILKNFKKKSFDSVKVYTYTDSNFSISFISFSQKCNPSMDKGKKKGSLSSLQHSLYQKAICSAQAKGKATQSFLSWKKLNVGEV